jgi:hypothetical protein
MENNNNGTLLAELIEKNYELIKKAELISIALFLTGFICYLFNIPGTNFILIIGSVLTAFTFFLQVFKIVEFEDFESFNILGSIAITNFIFRLNFMSLSVSMMAMLGFVVDSEKAIILLTVGSSTLIIILIVSLFAKIQEKSKVYDLKFYLRILTCLFFLAYLAVDKGIIK